MSSCERHCIEHSSKAQCQNYGRDIVTVKVEIGETVKFDLVSAIGRVGSIYTKGTPYMSTSTLSLGPQRVVMPTLTLPSGLREWSS